MQQGFSGATGNGFPKDAFFLMIALMAMAAGIAILMIRKTLKRPEGPDYDT